MSERRKKLAILHSAGTPRGVSHYLVIKLAEFLAGMDVEIIHLHGTRTYVPADAIFVHVDLSVVPREVALFAQLYPVQINGYALDISKSHFVDGLLDGSEPYPAPVIVKSNLNYGGAPERRNASTLQRAAARIHRMLLGRPRTLIAAKSDYRIFSDLADVPRGYFTPDTIVQKLMLEKAGSKHVLREYIFLGDLHFQNIEHSDSAIINEDEHIECLPFTPHPRLINMRERLKLDYGKIDFVMIDGEPFIFDANKTLGVGDLAENEAYSDDIAAMMMAFATEVYRMLSAAEPRHRPFTDEPTAGAKTKKQSAQRPRGVRTAARG